jgi:uncharacterized protein YjbI with pentapeptide repeats
MGADLAEADLSYADLGASDFTGAKLRRTRLHGATLADVVGLGDGSLGDDEPLAAAERAAAHNR